MKQLLKRLRNKRDIVKQIKCLQTNTFLDEIKGLWQSLPGEIDKNLIPNFPSIRYEPAMWRNY